MTSFFIELQIRNPSLWYFGLINFVFAFIFLVLSQTTQAELNQVSVWYKPFKFACSIGLYAWTMGWYCAYLPDFNQSRFNLVIIVLLGFELVYIAIQAGRGQLSHFNISTPFYAFLYVLMALAATLVSLYTAYVAWHFFRQPLWHLSDYYLWSIRLGLILFVIFALEGFVMGSRLSHTIGGPDGSEGLPILNWSLRHGDPRIAHFIGMHALQVLPFLAYHLLKDLKWTIVLSIGYALLAVFTLWRALEGRGLC